MNKAHTSGGNAAEDDVGSVPAERIRIFDTTLRDGEQSPGCSLRPRQKLTLAHAIAELGADVIEAGFAASSAADAEGIRTIAREKTADSGTDACRSAGDNSCSIVDSVRHDHFSFRFNKNQANASVPMIVVRCIRRPESTV